MSDQFESNYSLIQPQGTTGTFGGGVLSYVWSMSNPSVWTPSKTFLRCQFTVTTGTGAPQISQLLAVAENGVSNAFQACSVDAGERNVSRVSTAAAQISMLKARRGKSRAWLNSTGSSAFGPFGSFSERLVATCVDTKPVGVIGSASTYEEEISRAGCDTAATAEIALEPTAVAGGGAPAVSDHGLVTIAGGVALTDTILGAKFVCDNYTGTVIQRGDKAGADGGTKFIVAPSPPIAVAPTANWYFVQRNTTNSPQGKYNVEVMWQPPLGLFSACSKPLGGGSFKLELTPFADYATRMAESLFNRAPNALGVAVSDWNIVMEVPTLYLYTSREQYKEEATRFLLTEYSAYSNAMTSANKVLQLTIPRSTERIHVFLQDSAAGANITQPMSKFTNAARDDLKLTSIQLTYAGQTKFRTPWQSTYTGSTNELTALYYASLEECDQAADETHCLTARNSPPVIAGISGGAETMLEWFRRGPVWSFAFLRAASGSETDLTVDITFSGMTNPSNLFVVAEHSKTCVITSSMNQIVDVTVLDA